MAESPDADGGWEPHRARERDPQGGVISPLLANLFLHYAFDLWMRRNFPDILFERYADDAICHCRDEDQATALRTALATRFAECGLTLHPERCRRDLCWNLFGAISDLTKILDHAAR